MNNLKYIKANGTYYWNTPPKTQDPERFEGCYLPVCAINEIAYGGYEIHLFDRMLEPTPSSFNNQEPNARIIVYPAGIEEIVYTK